jgi:hypothetical protein
VRLGNGHARIHPEAEAARPCGQAEDVSGKLGENVFAEESYLFDEVGQAFHL